MNNAETAVWPPSYQIRVSQRAKHINIKLGRDSGLELVIPSHSSEQEGIDFMNSKRRWIEKHLPLLSTPTAPKIKTIPKQLTLPSLQQSWQIRCEPISHYRQIKLLHLPQELVLCGPSDNYERSIASLNNWLRIQAEKYFLLWMREISERCQLSFTQLNIRSQKTRWGSCNRDKSINLNMKLLFMPFRLVEYVIIHELCHTVHMNHSKRFWSLVKKHCPNHDACSDELRHGDSYLPDWV